MVELKALASPKVAVPIVGIVVLVVVSTLVALFYVRNPTVTDNIFGGGNAENSTESSNAESDHVTQSAMGSSGHLPQSTTPGSHEQSTSTSPTATTSASPVTLPMTPSPDQSSTPMHAIEPVQHL